jgi:hypothetical protein
VVEYSTQNPNIAGSNPASGTEREKIADKMLCLFFIFGVCSVEHKHLFFPITFSPSVNCQHQKRCLISFGQFRFFFLSLFNLFCRGTIAAADSTVNFILPQLLSGRIFDSKS